MIACSIGFKNLREGNYRLTETKSPKGYSVLDEPIPIKIILNRTFMGYEINVEVCNDTGSCSKPFIVINEKEPVLPNTGGYVWIEYIIGITILLTALLMFKYRKLYL